MSKRARPTVLIPAFNPAACLVTLVEELLEKTQCNVLVINDGSDARFDSVFYKLQAPRVHVLRHRRNRGKGAALKTGFRHCLAAGAPMVVTADADGQHSMGDIIRLCEEGREGVILGVRDLSAGTPWRSRVGNALARWLFRLRSGRKLRDTQTGLRRFPASVLADLCRLPGDRYDFESRVLLLLVKKNIPFTEIPIATIYLNDNDSSHFNPVLDSLRIYWALMRPDSV